MTDHGITRPLPFLAWMFCLSALVWGMGQPPGYEDQDQAHKYWDEHVRDRPQRLLDLDADCVEGLRFCAGLKPEDRGVAALMMALHHSATVKRKGEERMPYHKRAFTVEDFAEYAELVKGGRLSADEKRGVDKLYRRFASAYTYDAVMPRAGGSYFAGMGAAMERYVFRTSSNYKQAVENLRKLHGWAVDIEEAERPSLDLIRRAIRKGIPVILEPSSHIPKEEGFGPFVGVAVLATPSGVRLIVADPAAMTLRRLSEADLMSADERAQNDRVPPRTPDRQTWGSSPLTAGCPMDYVLSVEDALPPWCVAVDYRQGFWRAVFVHHLRKDWKTWGPEIETIVGGTATDDGEAMPDGGADGESARLWRKYVQGKSHALTTDNWDVVNGLDVCKVDDRISPRLAAFATVAFHGHPHGCGLAGFGFEWSTFVDYLRELRWSGLSEGDRERVAEYHRQRIHANLPTPLVGNESAYRDGTMVWGLSQTELRELRRHFGRMRRAHSTEAAPTQAAAGTAMGQEALRLAHAVDGSEDWMRVVDTLERLHGWRAVVEEGRGLPFAAYRKVVEAGQAGLVTDRQGGACRVLAGFVVDGKTEYLLLADPRLVQPVKAAPDVSALEHVRHALLPPASPGRRAYMRQCAAGTRLLACRLDSRLPLPQGLVFEPFDRGRYGLALVHDWQASLRAHETRLEALLTDGPPELIEPVSFHLRLPRPMPERVPREVAIVGCHSEERDVFPVQAYSVANAERMGAFAETRTVEFDLVPGTYFVKVSHGFQEAVCVGTVCVTRADQGKVVDVQWCDIPESVPFRLRLPASVELQGWRNTMVTLASYRWVPYAACWRGGSPARPETIEMSARPGTYRVFIRNRNFRRRGHIGTVCVTAESAGQTLDVEPLPE